MNQQEKASWERARAKGAWHYIWTRGVVASVVFALYFLVRRYAMSDRASEPLELFLLCLVLPAFGLIWGAVAWEFYEYQYRKSE